ncbi:uncharacterized protein BX664DRAFT_348699 [Halteromyces radiatus]|uniref:uncharacterized protein n=1 Tax=Halteromyces radiatus TaxID=101107 RepID=UPI002220AFF0|nr:uncharacterized protein BX664DRAFT_348699 [Halteromyces radiatus]KAI8093483.1 hypothetical protein BX664DRAFT_348699 [Halteromyces radiatus]
MPSHGTTDLEKDVLRAENILSSFTEPGKGQDIKKLIPPSVLARAHGIVLIRIYRVGLMFSHKSGKGIIIARLPDGSWSAPSGVSMTSVGIGHQAGGEVIDSILVLNYRSAVKAFFDAGGQLQVGLNMSVAAGPLGRSADIAASTSTMNHFAASYSYSSSKGLFAGYSFEGSKISERVKTNANFYGRFVSAREILTGTVPPPQMASGIYNILHSIGATGPQPGITFGPIKSIIDHSLMSTPPSSPQSDPGALFYSAQESGMTPNGYPLEKQSYHRSALHQSPSIRLTRPEPRRYEPPHTRIPDADSMPPKYTHPSPPSYESSMVTHRNSQPSLTITTGDQINQSSSNPFRQTLTPSSPTELPPLPSNHHKYTNKTCVVVAKYDFNGQEQGDLAFQKGEHITVILSTEDRNSWWHGQIGSRTGSFPANFTEDL